MRQKWILIVGIGVLFIMLIVGLFYFLVISGAVFSLIPNPPKPDIINGEFPISVICEIDGEIKEIKDTVICEFDGFENLGSAGKYRKWKAYLKSGNERMTLLRVDETSELYCSYGMPEYYMDDLRFQTREEYEQMRSRDLDSMFIIFGKWENGELKSNFVSRNEAFEKYGLKIIDVQYSPPIQNSFK